ncbi:MAG TPA: isopentenyl-diphosphate Delta-isomerase [Tenuifilaceae bacterium]|nr:isopentenyl-diphosphate Delta-isomerase [Tenuifilaceae bacterium]HPE18943.1 isopentenyl-diphosphate Delta-isomerase [Tenuifilaceae bacterium]HPJ46422.1 isopentenyl-diphosphate Delta-isomerase [Tenuifilaceae bacterium]HPQ34587.1 isopentenyl-diphosphate Delta-isomerase [Tenuifilaceae bacterium]HRX67443.1 isopentenyl-diphosphate Delta-isomerase [Tenuifilaceae bacterium]
MDSFIATVNSNDEVIGFKSKSEVHSKGVLHRAFSIFIFNSKGELMLQQRSHGKYHSPGLWTNTCCSHLPETLSMKEIVHHRLTEEMGFDTELKYVGKFHYQVNFDNGLTENEIDHIYVGFYEKNPSPNPKEVEAFRWINISSLLAEIEEQPQNFTYWLKYILHNHSDLLKIE